MRYEFSLNENRLAIIENNSSAYKDAWLAFLVLLALGLFVIVIFGSKEPLALLAGVIVLAVACGSFVEIFKKYNNLEQNRTVYSLVIDSKGITKPYGSDNEKYFYSWSQIQNIVRADSLYSIAYSNDSERYMEEEEFSATNAFLLIFKQECPLHIGERSLLMSRVTGKGLDYIYLDVPEIQIEATENALIKFSPDRVSMHRYKSVSFDCKTKNEIYLP